MSSRIAKKIEKLLNEDEGLSTATSVSMSNTHSQTDLKTTDTMGANSHFHYVKIEGWDKENGNGITEGPVPAFDLTDTHVHKIQNFIALESGDPKHLHFVVVQ